jgi:hypothetical protein
MKPATRARPKSHRVETLAGLNSAIEHDIDETVVTIR